MGVSENGGFSTKMAISNNFDKEHGDEPIDLGAPYPNLSQVPFDQFLRNFPVGPNTYIIWLAVWNMNFMSIMYGMSSFPLTNSYFSRWLSHHQPVM